MLLGALIIMRHGERHPINKKNEIHKFLYNKYKIHSGLLTKNGHEELEKDWQNIF